MSWADVVLALVAVAVLARMAVSARRVTRGLGAARRELAIWREHHPR